MADNLLTEQAFKLKGRLYTLTVLSLIETCPKSFAHQLKDVINTAPRLFQKTPVVLDCSLVDCRKLDLQVICNEMRSQGLVLVAVQGGDELIDVMAQSLGLAVVHASASHDKLINVAQAKPAKTPVAAATKTMLIASPVRSGQQVVSKGDLIIASTVSHGSELLANGNIHVYGSLRGRALAGIKGNKTARIFCQSLDAELVSIAGYYRLSDAIEPISGPCQIYLKDGHIQIEPI